MHIYTYIALKYCYENIFPPGFHLSNQIEEMTESVISHCKFSSCSMGVFLRSADKSRIVKQQQEEAEREQQQQRKQQHKCCSINEVSSSASSAKEIEGKITPLMYSALHIGANKTPITWVDQTIGTQHEQEWNKKQTLFTSCLVSSP